jgi:hypothetical protein
MDERVVVDSDEAFDALVEIAASNGNEVSLDCFTFDALVEIAASNGNEVSLDCFTVSGLGVSDELEIAASKREEVGRVSEGKAHTLCDRK